MFVNSILAAGALINIASAIPLHQHQHKHQKRDVVWETQLVQEFVTVPVTTTVFVNPGGTPAANFGEPSPTRTVQVFQTITVHPSPAPQGANPLPPKPQQQAQQAPPVPQAPPADPPVNTPAADPATPPVNRPVNPPAAPPVNTPSPPPVQAPRPDPQPQPQPQPDPQPPADNPPSGGGGGSSAPSGQTFGGDLTYYTPGLGSCGQTNTESDKIVAVAAGMMTKALAGAANPNDNPYCGKSITISYGGKTATATIEDTCPGCADGGLDLTPTLFEEFSPLSAGRLTGMKWWFN